MVVGGPRAVNTVAYGWSAFATDAPQAGTRAARRSLKAGAARADNRSMLAWIAAIALLLSLVPASARAETPTFTDSLAPETVPLSPGAHHALWREAHGPGRPDSLSESLFTILATLRGAEATCRTNLFMKEQEPGSPWLEWRSFGRVDV